MLAAALIWVLMAVANNKLDSWAAAIDEKAELHFSVKIQRLASQWRGIPFPRML